MLSPRCRPRWPVCLLSILLVLLTGIYSPAMGVEALGKGSVLTYDAIVFTVEEAKQEYAQKHEAMDERDIWRERAQSAEAFNVQLKQSFEEYRSADVAEDLARVEEIKALGAKIKTLERKQVAGTFETWLLRIGLIVVATQG